MRAPKQTPGVAHSRGGIVLGAWSSIAPRHDMFQARDVERSRCKCTGLADAGQRRCAARTRASFLSAVQHGGGVPHGDCLSRTILRRDQREIVFRLSAAGLDAHKAGLPKSMSFGRGGRGEWRGRVGCGTTSGRPHRPSQAGPHCEKRCGSMSRLATLHGFTGRDRTSAILSNAQNPHSSAAAEPTQLLEGNTSRYARLAGDIPAI